MCKWKLPVFKIINIDIEFGKPFVRTRDIPIHKMPLLNSLDRSTSSIINRSFQSSILFFAFLVKTNLSEVSIFCVKYALKISCSPYFRLLKLKKISRTSGYQSSYILKKDKENEKYFKHRVKCISLYVGKVVSVKRYLHIHIQYFI